VRPQHFPSSRLSPKISAQTPNSIRPPHFTSQEAREKSNPTHHDPINPIDPRARPDSRNPIRPQQRPTQEVPSRIRWGGRGRPRPSRSQLPPSRLVSEAISWFDPTIHHPWRLTSCSRIICLGRQLQGGDPRERTAVRAHGAGAHHLRAQGRQGCRLRYATIRSHLRTRSMSLHSVS